MSLEFRPLVDQVQAMGRYLGERDTQNGDRLEYAVQLFNEYGCDLAHVHERIEQVRASAVSGYRGATPAPPPYDENLCYVWDAPPPPESAAIIAADGSQIYPDPHAAALYYLTNIGVFTYFYQKDSAGRLPLQQMTPELVYYDDLLLDNDGKAVTNPTVNARRTVQELQALAKQAWGLSRVEMMGAVGLPVIALHDGNLLKFFSGTEISGAGDLEKEYLNALRKLYETPAILAGYNDNPRRSTSVISLLHLLSLPPSEVNDASLKTNGVLEGLADDQLYKRVLGPGDRSAIMTQNSPQNVNYIKRAGAEFEIAFFYLNVSDGPNAKIVRVEVPMWVARDKMAIDLLHGALIAQTAIQGRKRYPYALTRADELAVVGGREKGQLDEMIRIALRQNQLEPEASQKLQSKGLARAGKRQHRIGG